MSQTTNSVSNLEDTLKIENEIRKSEDKLVQMIEKALNNQKSYGQLDNSQFRNLLRVSTSTESPEVIKNFLRYQLGRDKKWGKGKDSLAITIINDIDTHIRQQATEIVSSEDENKHREVWIKLIRLYLGYGARYLVYLKSFNKSNNNNK